MNNKLAKGGSLSPDQYQGSRYRSSLLVALLMTAIAGSGASPLQGATVAPITAGWSVTAWSGGYTAYLNITNTSSSTISNWTATLTTPQQETSVWNATMTGPVSSVYKLTPASCSC
jgi:hypothetical protein